MTMRGLLVAVTIKHPSTNVLGNILRCMLIAYTLIQHPISLVSISLVENQLLTRLMGSCSEDIAMSKQIRTFSDKIQHHGLGCLHIVPTCSFNNFVSQVTVGHH